MYRYFLCILFFAVIRAYPAEGIQSDSRSLNNEKIVIAKVAGREITYKDFLERAEYTMRPAYCRGSSNNDKNIVLNTLIAEKLLAIEADYKNELAQNENFLGSVLGRREQKMRELLYYAEGTSKVQLDKKEVEKLYELAGRTYKIEYFNIDDKNSAASLQKKFDGIADSSDFSVIFAELNNEGLLDSIPEKEISWYSPEVPMIHHALFSEKLSKNQVIGPVAVNDTTNLFIKIKGWTDIVAVSESEIKLRWTEVSDKLTRIKADSIYDKFVIKVMGNKKLQLNPEVFQSLVNIFAPLYKNFKNKSEAEGDFMQLVSGNDIEIQNSQELEKSYEDIRTKILMSIGGEDWTVEDLKKQIDKHPLVFRKGSFDKDFPLQLKLAIVDLVRDLYLTQEAYKRGYNKEEVVTHYEQLWLDAGIALYERDMYLNNVDTTIKLTPAAIEEHLNPHIKSLLKKYSNQIEINVNDYNNIRLTNTDMYTLQSDVPYKIFVPAFPQLTTYNRLDYGKKLIN